MRQTACLGYYNSVTPLPAALLERSRLLVLHLLFLSCVFDPAGAVLGAKYVLFLAWVLLSMAAMLAGLQSRPSRMLVGYCGFFAIVLPTYGLFIAFVRGGMDGELLDTSYLSAGAFFTYALFLTDRIWVGRAMNALRLALRLLTVAITGFATLEAAGLVGDAAVWLDESKIAVITSRSYGGLDFPYIYFVTSPMLVVLLASDVWRIADRFQWNRILAVGLTVGALFLSGTRANMLMALAGPPIILLWRRIGGPRAATVLLGASLVGILLFLATSPSVLVEMVSSEETNNATKLGYLPYYGLILSDPITLLFGQGFNAHIWSRALADMLPEGSTITELTYFDLLRVFGLVGAVPTLGMLLYLALSGRTFRADFPFVGVAFFLYAMLALTNPYLFSSNGMTVAGLVAAVVARACAGQARR